MLVILTFGRIGTPADLIRIEGPFWEMLKNNSDYHELVSLVGQIRP